MTHLHDKEKVSLYNAEYYQRHRDKISKRKKQQYLKDPEKYKKATHEWVANNREKWNAYMRDRRRYPENKKREVPIKPWTNIKTIGLSNQTVNILTDNGVNTIQDLLILLDLFSENNIFPIKGISKTEVEKIYEALNQVTEEKTNEKSSNQKRPQMYNFQIESISQLLSGKRIIVSGMGSGKTAMAVKWAEKKCEETGKNKLLVVTTASKTRTNDFQDEFSTWCSPAFIKDLSTFTIISWHKLANWVNQNWSELEDYIFIFDEVQKAKAGIGSQMGKAFLKITHRSKNWAGFTGTPGDTWMSFYPYFAACNLVRNKVSYINQFANVDMRFGYPEIIGWRNEDKLREMWSAISYAPDTHKIMEELPQEIDQYETFKKPSNYSKLLTTRTDSYGNFLDTPMALCNELRRSCFTKDKQQWVADFVESLSSGCVFYYNFVTTGDKIKEILQKALPNNARIWRLDGKHHEIPTKDSFHPHDVVLCQWQSGSEALNLQFINYWVSIEPNYSYSVTEQAKGRIRRIGQELPQFYYFLQTEGTIETDIYKCLIEKREFSEKNWCVKNKIIELDKD